VLHNGTLIAMHNDENVDSSEKGRMICIKLPEKLDRSDSS
jgi:outer membrane protein assembly factor BamB